MAEYRPVTRQVEDALVHNSRREACLILGLWLLSLVYTVSLCYLWGYLSHEPMPVALGPDVASLVGPLEGFQRDPSQLGEPLGLAVPDWVFYGILAPWAVCIGLTLWFCLRVFSEDDLGPADD